MEELDWLLNVQIVEQRFLNLGKHGKWLDAQTKKENGCNSKLDCLTATNAKKHSE